MSKPSFDIIPLCSVNPSSINIYSEVRWSPYRPTRPKTEHLIKSDKKTHGKVSSQARRKASKAIDYLLYLANSKPLPDTLHGRALNFKVAFVTLTLPSKQVHSDNELKESCLNQLLVELRLRYRVKNYIWRAEKQKNGNIHFHVLVDKFIPWSELRDRWNRIVNKLGYVDRYRDQMREFHRGGFRVRQELLANWDYKSQIKAYKAGKANDFSSPNSTDIHSLYRISRVKDYLCKYYTKNEDNQEVQGRLWGCNEELSNVKGATAVIDNGLKLELDELIKEQEQNVYRSEYFTSINVSVRIIALKRQSRLWHIFKEYMVEQFGMDYQQELST